MPLHLVTGPANAGKAKVVLDAFEDAAHAGDEPVLVVPTFADVTRYRRELAERGLVFDATVVRFEQLLRLLAERAGVRGEPIRGLARERVAAVALRRAQLGPLTPLAASPGFLRAFLGLCDELDARGVTPQRVHVAMEQWGAAEPGRADYAAALASGFGSYRRMLTQLGRDDAALHAARALDGLRADPSRWRATPVALYGFDDLTPLQLDAVDALAGRCGAAVTVSLPSEPGEARPAFDGRHGTVGRLRALADRVTELAADAGHYAPGAREALHHLERHLFSSDGPRASTDAGVVLLRGGGTREELELVAAHVRVLLRRGLPAAEIAIGVRRPDAVAATIERVMAVAGVAISLEREVPAGHTPPGRSLIGLLRAATAADAGPADLLAWLRAPGFVKATGAVDTFEAELLRDGVRTVAEARSRWETARPAFRLWDLDEVAAAAKESGAALCARLVRTLDRQRTAGPPRDPGRPPSPSDTVDARVTGQLAAALEGLAVLAGEDRDLVPAPDELARLLADVPVRVGEPPGADRVVVADPLALRARRVRALFLCDLQEGVFPAVTRPDALLGEAERRAINAASGLGLRLTPPDDASGRERHLFYAAVSRPEALLALSWHAADERGDPAVPSPFLDEVLDLLPSAARERMVTRPLGAAGFADDLAVTDRERHLAAAAASVGARPDPIAPLTDPGVLAELAQREVWSASSLEAWLACPVRWFVERLLRPEDLLPEPEPLGRGRLVHAVLEHVVGALRERRPGPLGPERVTEARQLVHEALALLGPDHRLSVDPQRDLIARRRVEADLLALVDHLAGAGWRFAPQALELAFGLGEGTPEAVELAPGLRLSGRIDRVDVDASGEYGVVVDYKGTTAFGADTWIEDRHIQAALYARALPALLGVEPAAAIYQPASRPKDLRARGLGRDDVDSGAVTFKKDLRDEEAFSALLEAAVDLAAQAVAEIRAGRLEPRPATCGFRGDGCQYPSICRCEA